MYEEHITLIYTFLEHIFILQRKRYELRSDKKNGFYFYNLAF